MNTHSMSQSSQVQNQRQTRSSTSARRGFFGRGSWRVVLALGAFMGLGAAGQGTAWADCPDVPAACPHLAWGWQGQCWDVAWCSDCGPAKCPLLPPSYRDLPKIANDLVLCPQAFQNRMDGCSNPLKDPGTLMYNDVFHQACNQHDVCYSTLGLRKEKCDIDFYMNMMFTCDNYYRGAENALQRGACKSAALTYFSAVSGTPQGKKAYDDDQDWAKRCCLNPACDKPPPPPIPPPPSIPPSP